MMSQQHRDLLNKNRLTLVRNVVLEEIFYSSLRGNGIFTEEIIQIIESKKTNGDRVGTMLDYIVKRGPRAFSGLIVALVESDQLPIANVLDARLTTEITSQRKKPTESHITQPSEPQGPTQVLPTVTKPLPPSVTPAEPKPKEKSPKPSSSSPETSRKQVVTQPTDGLPTDFDDDIKQYIANLKSTNFMTLHFDAASSTVQHEDAYERNGRDPHGLAVILRIGKMPSNVTATETVVEVNGSFDTINLLELFNGLKFKTESLEDIRGEVVMENLLGRVEAYDLESCDMFVLCILGYGSDGILYADHTRLNIIQDIAPKFDSCNCPRLKDKPKIFLVQLASLDDSGIDNIDARVDELSISREPGNNDVMVDMFFFNVSTRLVKSKDPVPSWFVWSLVTVFSKFAATHHLSQLLDKVKVILDSQKPLIQSTSLRDTLKKPVYLV